MNYSNQIKAFSEISFSDYANDLNTKLQNEISNKGKEYILGVDEHEFRQYLVDKYSLMPLNIDDSTENIDQPIVVKEWLENRWHEKYQQEVYTFTVKYSFTGSAVIFKIRPDNWVMTSTTINVSESGGIVSYSFKLYKKDPIEFNNAKREFYKKAFANVNNANAFIQRLNNALPGSINQLFKVQKDKYLEENDFFAAINVRPNQSTASIFPTPTIKKKIIAQPTVPSNKEFASEPFIAKENYEDILKVIYDSGKNMEKKPALYKDKDEEGLRDQFLFVLETRYEGTTATGETFNRAGKTDIALKYAQDGTNIFVAECKFWHGNAEFLKAISQLFDRYLTWRDSKAALIMFVTNTSFSLVLENILSVIKTHPYFVRHLGNRGESSFSYIFHLPQDKNKLVYFEILAFHYDK